MQGPGLPERPQRGCGHDDSGKVYDDGVFQIRKIYGERKGLERPRSQAFPRSEKALVGKEKNDLPSGGKLGHPGPSLVS